MPFYEANEEPEITYTGSMHNAEIICTVRSTRNNQSASLRISAYAARAMQRLVCVRWQHEWIVRRSSNLEPNDTGPPGSSCPSLEQ